MNKLKQSSKGFNLLELMITLAIIAIIVGLAYPSYSAYNRKARRGDAQQQLMDWANQYELWRANNPSYVGAGATPPTNSYYTLSQVSADAVSYTIQAVAGGNQANDKEKGTSCTTLQLNQGGPTGGNEVCWGN